MVNILMFDNKCIYTRKQRLEGDPYMIGKLQYEKLFFCFWNPKLVLWSEI